MFNIIVDVDDPTKRRFFVRPASVTIGELLVEYTAELGVEGSFVDEESSSIAGDREVGDLEELAPATVRLIFEETRHFAVRVVGDEASWRLKCRPTKTPAELELPLQQLIGRELEGRDFRLRSSHGPLLRDVALGRQLLPQQSDLLIDVEVRLQVRESWQDLTLSLDGIFPSDDCREISGRIQEAVEEEEEERMSPIPDDESFHGWEPDWESEPESVSESGQADHVLRSEPVFRPLPRDPESQSVSSSEQDSESALLPFQSTADTDCRFSLEGRRRPFQGQMIRALSGSGAPWRRCIFFLVDLVRSVLLIEGIKIVTRQLWPSDRVDELAHGSLMYDGKLITDETARDLAITTGAVIVKDPLTITLCLSDYEKKIVKLAKWATVGDLRREAMLCQGRRQAHLRRGDHFLDDDSLTLPEAGIVDHSAVTVDDGRVCIQVQLKDGPVEWSPEERQLSFTDFIAQLADRSTSVLEELVNTTFQCSGCLRKLWNQKEQQRIPANCCSTKSCSLRLWTPPKSGELWSGL